jgi:putative heme-binding domain-containing protein
MRIGRGGALLGWIVLGALAGAAGDDMPDRAALRQFALSHPGNPARGRVLFEAETPVGCWTCHKVHDVGGTIGPDLTDIGNKFDRAHLIESVLDPSRQIVEGYRLAVVALADGRVVTGFPRAETGDRLTLVDVEGRAHAVAKAEIVARQWSDASPMPEGLAAGLRPAEFGDLIAYLESLRPGRPPTPGERVAEAFQLPPGFGVRLVADGLTGATALEVAPDGRVFVCEQTGALRVVRDDTLLPEPFVTLPVDSTWERGLIGVTLDPKFPAQPYVYVCYVTHEPYPHHRVSRLTADGDRAVPGSETILLEGDDQSKLGGTVPAGHQGGALHLGGDGLLYIALGEQTAGAPAQDLHSLLGKILRIRPDGSIPEDNPFCEQTDGKYRAIWALGLRNPFTFAVQAGTGRIFANDVGQDTWEEVNAIERGGNYGWPQSEGPTTDPRFRGPIHAYPAASVAGAAFAPADLAWPDDYRGRYFFMDFVRGWIHVLDPEHPERPPAMFASGLRRPVDLGFAPDGSLYVLVRDAWVIDGEFRPGTGRLLKIVREDGP